MKEALLIMAHGSPHPAANEPVFRVLEILRAREAYPIVALGFLECNKPRIPEAIQACVAQEAKRIIAVPFFLHTGNHVAEDLPALLQEAQGRYPHVEFRLGGFLGKSSRLTNILAARALATIRQASPLSNRPFV
ncbi:MAG TPA: CbiX/SirB N-terminal domain-containing protein [Chthonomonadales bacterium]|nr:CbiX/SirB N-terminal domain-containing protein [Chthonomonadales bacterium]